MIAAAIELIQVKLDELPQPQRVEVIAELTRRLAMRLHTEAQKLDEAFRPGKKD